MTALTITERSGPVTAKEAERWTEAQIPYENLAGDEERARRATGIATQIVSESEDRTHPLKRRWRATHYMLAGNTLDRAGPTDIHLPELYTIVETITPRVEEAILDKDPPFHLKGRDEMDQREADVLAAFVDWQFDQADLRDLVQPAVRDMLTSQCAIFKVFWDRRVAERVKRKVTKKVNAKTGETTYKFKTKIEEEVEYDGPVYRLVDPFDFIIDTKSTSPKNARYIGDRCWMAYDEILRYGKMFGWTNLDQLKDKANSGSTFDTRSDTYKNSRDPTGKYSLRYDQTRQDGRPGDFEVVNLWLKADFEQEGKYEEYQLVVINGRVCVCIQRNPFHRQFRPYVTMRVARNGHEFFGTGPLDNAVRINQHLDRLHSVLLRAAEVGACPMVFAEEDSDLPDSLYKVKPFSVYKGVGNVRFSQLPDGVLRGGAFMLQTLERKIQEVTGAFKIQMGQDVSGTATESTLALQEGNRRIRSIVRAFGNGLRDLIDITLKLNAQFVINKVPFRVLGKRATALRAANMEIGPDTLLKDVDIEVVGLKSLNQYGLKATGYQVLANSTVPFIMKDPDRYDTTYLVHAMASELIGPEDADKLVKLLPNPDDMRPPEAENAVMLAGGTVEIHEMDNHQEHLQKHKPLFDLAMREDSKLDERAKAEIIRHYMDTGMALKNEQAKAQAMQKRQAMLPAPPDSANGSPSGGQKSGESGRSSPRAGGFSAEMDMLGEGSPLPGQTPGETPGPPDSRKQPKAGREKRPISQSQNQPAR